jgi:hypothetical protein
VNQQKGQTTSDYRKKADKRQMNGAPCWNNENAWVCQHGSMSGATPARQESRQPYSYFYAICVNANEKSRFGLDIRVTATPKRHGRFLRPDLANPAKPRYLKPNLTQPLAAYRVLFN